MSSIRTGKNAAPILCLILLACLLLSHIQAEPVVPSLPAAAAVQPSLVCNSSLALLLATRFRALGKKGRDTSNCPDEVWLPLMADADDKARYIMFNVGYNKGYNFANWMHLFAPATRMTPAEWFRQIDEAKTALPWQKACGECNDCHVTFGKTARQSRFRAKFHAEAYAHASAGAGFNGSNGSVNIDNDTTTTTTRLVMVGVDLNEQNTHLVKTIMNNVGIKRGSGRNNITSVHPPAAAIAAAAAVDTKSAAAPDNPNFDGITLELHHAAVSDHDGHLAIKKCAPGVETCAITPHELWNASIDDLRRQSDQYYLVRLLTVDSLAKEVFSRLRERHSSATQQPMEIDILMVDTEGNDALVLKGSANMLSRQMVRCLIFEYHFFGQWEFHKLADVVQRLSQDGYDCFFQGQKRLWALSNGCWHDLYEFKGWSNVMCLKRGDVWMSAIRHLVVDS